MRNTDGIVDVGDICKALCLNVDMVMVGGMFAGTDEAEGNIIEKHYETNIGAISVKHLSKCATIIKVNNQLNKIFEKYAV